MKKIPFLFLLLPSLAYASIFPELKLELDNVKEYSMVAGVAFLAAIVMLNALRLVAASVDAAVDYGYSSLRYWKDFGVLPKYSEILTDRHFSEVKLHEKMYELNSNIGFEFREHAAQLFDEGLNKDEVLAELNKHYLFDSDKVKL